VVTEEAVSQALADVIDPELRDNVVALGMVRRIEIGPDGAVDVTLALTTAGCPLRAQLQQDTRSRVAAVPGVSDVRVHFGEMTAEQKRQLMERARWKAREREVPTDIPTRARVIAVSSGKGGVGKSSVTANLAAALAAGGATVGVLDADIGGFSIPRMLGLEGRVRAEDHKIVPLEKAMGAGRLKVVSMGSIEGAEEDQAVMLRGLMLNRAVQHFLEDVRWGDLDYLLVDMPPGTSDIQMGLARMMPRAEVLIVTTPAPAAAAVAARAADMARKGYLRVIGIVENMSAFVCEHGTRHSLFGEGGGQWLAAQVGAPLLAEIPLGAGGPDPESFTALAERIAGETVPMAGCSARLDELLTGS
jgi:ATP-binding protein involved in chromosome partitioning